MIEEAVYDLSELARANWHVHTNRSSCAAFDMSPEQILAQAEFHDLRMVALVDHHHKRRHPIVRDVKRVRKAVERFNPRLKVLVGAELSAYGGGRYSDSKRMNRKVGYRLYACNHYHVPGWEHPEELSARAYAEHVLHVLTALLHAGRADAVAHPFVGSYLKAQLDEPTSVTRAISDRELGEVLELGRRNEIAWEINTRTAFEDPDFTRRYWNVGREVGVVFRLGTDAHSLAQIDTRRHAEQLQALLGGAA